MAQGSSSIIQISRKGLLIWIGLIVFISFWMFVLGVMVGRGMAPVNLETGKLEQELADLKARMLKEKQEAAASAAAGPTDEKAQLGFYEALKNPGKESTFQPPEPANPVRRKPMAEAPAAAAAKPRPATAPPPEPVPAAKRPAAPGPTAESKPETVSAANQFAVQVASVQDAKGADRMVAELRGKGYQAYHTRSEIPGKGVWYRIRVGDFKDRNAAAKMLRQLKNDKFGGMVVSIK